MKVNILIVEDEVDIREGVSEYLSEVGYNVISAEDGMQAIEIFNKNSFEVFFVKKNLLNMFLNTSRIIFPFHYFW